MARARRPIALITPIGSATLQRAIKENLFDKCDFVVMNAIPGSDAFRKPGHPRLFHVRAGDGDQIAKIVQHIKTLGSRSLHILHQDLPVGAGGLGMARNSGNLAGVKVEGVEAKLNDAALAAAATSIAAQRPEQVLLIGTPKYMADAITQSRRAGIRPPLFALSYLPPPLLLKTAGEADARGVASSQAFPNRHGRVLPLRREFQATMKRYAPALQAYNVFHLEGYVSARVLVEGFKRGAAAGSEQLARSRRNMRPIELGGFVVDFSKGNPGGTLVDSRVVSVAGRLIY